MDPTKRSTADPVTEEELHALVDGRLSGEQRQRVEARLARDPAAAATRAAWQRQRDELAALHRSLLNQPVPASLQSAARRTGGPQQRLEPWWRWGAVAAAITLSFGLGWQMHGQFGLRPVAQQLAANSGGAREFARQASVAHLVYAPEQRHPVEVLAAQQEHLVQWLSKRLARPLKVPDLSAQGYELVGGRLLPGEDGARAQFMFQSASGERITLYLGALKALAGGGSSPPGSPDRRETAFSFSTDGPVPGFYWVDQGFGYALAGALSRDKLMALAQAVYQQL